MSIKNMRIFSQGTRYLSDCFIAPEEYEKYCFYDNLHKATNQFGTDFIRCNDNLSVAELEKLFKKQTFYGYCGLISKQTNIGICGVRVLKCQEFQTAIPNEFERSVYIYANRMRESEKNFFIMFVGYSNTGNTGLAGNKELTDLYFSDTFEECLPYCRSMVTEKKTGRNCCYIVDKNLQGAYYIAPMYRDCEQFVNNNPAELTVVNLVRYNYVMRLGDYVTLKMAP